ncbi:AEC family transporter [Salinibacillus xinjiangensis]|uniref:AEC family transporter n=1 Tax=Salinibacillus xinjiangensis TaxID=1229268 RepID=UPI00129A6251|nr:AEC family transporter [Salinibacillus xinjiangensis]
MQIIINAVIPIFAIILCGYLAGRFQLVSVSGAQSLNHFVYYFALPALLFFSLSTTPIEQITNWTFIRLNFVVTLICFFGAMIVVRKVFKKKSPNIALHGMAASYGNTGFLGIPFVVAAFGQEAAVPAAIATFTYDIVIITLVILIFELSNAKGDTKKLVPLMTQIGKGIFLNPINLSLILGVVISSLQITVPNPIQVFADILGSAAGPTALFALGLGLLSRNAGTSNGFISSGEIGVIIGLKLILMPVVMGLLILYVFSLDELWATVALILSALPIGALVNVFAEKYGVMVDRAPKMILLSTVLSIFTLSVLLILIG